jgi:hypothetical protein
MARDIKQHYHFVSISAFFTRCDKYVEEKGGQEFLDKVYKNMKGGET